MTTNSNLSLKTDRKLGLRIWNLIILAWYSQIHWWAIIKNWVVQDLIDQQKFLISHQFLLFLTLFFWNIFQPSQNILTLHEILLQVDETAPEKPQPAVQSEEQPETITSNTDEQETIEDIENFIANKPTEEVTQKEAEITPDGQAKGNWKIRT